MALSERLQLVFDHLLPNEDVWDFCCDHGYLGGTAYKSQLFKDIYFVDPVPSIMDSLQNRFQTFVYKETSQSKAYFLTQKGETVDQIVQGTISIIGVGGSTICEILKGLAQNHKLQAKRIICGPHRDYEKVLTMIHEDDSFKNYKLKEKQSVIENGRQRDFFIFDLIIGVL